jgi:peptide/nickel transport system permease protein
VTADVTRPGVPAVSGSGPRPAVRRLRHPAHKILLRRAIQLVVVLVLVTMFAALLTSLMPGDPASALLPHGTAAQRAALDHELGLDRPLPVRYAKWLGAFVTGDLGDYYTTSGSTPVADSVRTAWPVTLQLVLYSQLLAVSIALVLGIATAYLAGSVFDRVVNAFAVATLAIPDYVIGLLLAYLLGVRLHVLPPVGYVRLTDDPGEHLRYMVLPCFALAITRICVYMQLLRADMIVTLRQSFIEFAKAKGLRNRRVLVSHALKPSSLTLITAVGLNVGLLIGTAVVIEAIFALPGLGNLLFQAITQRQFVALQSLVGIIAVAYVGINFAVDLMYLWLDPRTRHGADGR